MAKFRINQKEYSSEKELLQGQEIYALAEVDTDTEYLLLEPTSGGRTTALLVKNDEFEIAVENRDFKTVNKADLTPEDIEKLSPEPKVEIVKEKEPETAEPIAEN